MAFAIISPVLAEGYKPGDVTIKTSDVSDNIENIGETILGIIRVAGTIAAIGILMVVGIKYMMGSAEEKAEYKKTMIPYLVGAIVLFSASAIATAVVNFSK